jgi:hypothetical protein
MLWGARCRFSSEKMRMRRGSMGWGGIIVMWR